MLEQIQIEENEDFEFDLTELGLLNHSLVFEKDDETNELEIFISNEEEMFLVEDLIGDSLTSTEGKILFFNSEQKEITNDLLQSLLKNDTNKIDSYESK